MYVRPYAIGGNPNLVMFKYLQSVITIWRSHELVSWEWPWIHLIYYPQIMYGNRCSKNTYLSRYYLYSVINCSNLDIVGTVYHLVIHICSPKDEQSVLMSEFYSALFVSSTCFGPHRSIIRSVLHKLYSQTLVCGNTRTTRHVQQLQSCSSCSFVTVRTFLCLSL